MEVRGQLRAPADLLLVEKKYIVPIEWAGWLQNWSVCLRRGKSLSLLSVHDLSAVRYVCSPVTTSVMLFWHLQFKRIIECTVCCVLFTSNL
jgi:hypothetical protein